VPRGALAALAAATGAEAADAGGKLRGALASSVPGGATRSTWPTSITFGLSRLFQRAMSRQFWPLSSAMRISVSPGRTVK
jgi:uncharacterized protein (DUF697 family)